MSEGSDQMEEGSFNKSKAAEEEEDDIFGNNDDDNDNDSDVAPPPPSNNEDDDEDEDEDFGNSDADNDSSKEEGDGEERDDDTGGRKQKKKNKKEKKLKKGKKGKKLKGDKPKKKRSKFLADSDEDDLLDQDDDDDDDDGGFGGDDDLDDMSDDSGGSEDDNSGADSGDEGGESGGRSKKRKSSSKKDSSSKKKKGKGKKTKVGFAQRFLEDDIEGSDDDSEFEKEEVGEIREEELTLQMKEMEAKKKKRLAEAERLNKMTAEEIVAERYGKLTEAAKSIQQKRKEGIAEGEEEGLDADEMMDAEGGAARVGAGVLDRQSLLPSAKDATIWSVKCTPGLEQTLIRSILLRLTLQDKVKRKEIKSVFSTSPGYIYIEALAEPYAKSAINGLDGFYITTIKRIPLKDMTELFHVALKKAPVNEKDWVRITRGPLKGDLARVEEVLEGGTQAIIKAVPRVDYTVNPADKTVKKSLQKPPQQYFSVEAAQAAGFDYGREPLLKSSNEMFDRFQKEHYKNGMWYKVVTIDSYVTSDRTRVNPKVSELQWFIDDASNSGKSRSRNSDDYEDEEDEERDGSEELEEEEEDVEEEDENDDNEPRAKSSSKTSKASGSLSNGMDTSAKKGGGGADKKDNSNQHMTAEDKKIQQIIKLGGLDSLAKALAVEKIPYDNNEEVRIRSGDLTGVTGKVVSISHESNTVKIRAKGSSADIDVEASLITKYIPDGGHVKILKGPFMNYSGIAIKIDYNRDEVAILTDGTNNEVRCKINDLKVTDEVSTGIRSLNGYELYDLVLLNENEFAVVIEVTVENLHIVNHQDVRKEVNTQVLQGKRNNMKSSTYDSSNRKLQMGDEVNVHSGAYKGKKGTVKHIVKGTIWLHSNAHRKNSGIFVITGKNCLLAGVNRAKDDNQFLQQPSVLKPPTTVKHGPPGAQAMVARRGKDEDQGKVIGITSGAMKGLRGRIISATATHVFVELLSRNKKVTIERHQMMVLQESALLANRSSDKVRSFETADANNLSAATPNFVAETPKYFGSETPQYGYAETPQSERLDDMWKVNDDDFANDDDDMDTGGGHDEPQFTMPTASASSSSSSSRNNDIPYREGVVVQIKSRNSYAVIKQIIDASGSNVKMLVNPCNSDFNITSSENINLTSGADVVIVQPSLKGQKIVVVKGSKVGKIGVFEKIYESDYIVSIDGESHWLRPSQVAVYAF